MGKEWMAVIQQVIPKFVLTAYTVICSDHFNASDYSIRGKLGNTFLKKTAIPSLFNTSKLHLLYIHIMIFYLYLN